MATLHSDKNERTSFFVKREEETNPPKWVDKDGNEMQPPLYVESYKEALSFYASIYDENQTGKLPATIGMPQEEMALQAYALSAASEEASRRTKEELLQGGTGKKSQSSRLAKLFDTFSKK